MKDIYEGDAYNALKNYVIHGTSILGDELDTLKGLIALGGGESGIFRAAREGVELYRGIRNVTGDDLAKILGWDDFIESGVIKFNGTIKPRGSDNVMSFSRSFNLVEAQFARRSNPGRYSVIFTANTSENPGLFFDLSQGFYQSSSELTRFTDEHEFLALGPIKLNRIDWHKGDW